MAEKKKKNINNKRKKKKKSRKILRIFLFSFLFLILSAFVVGGGYVYAIVKNAPELNVNNVLSLSQQSRIYDNKEQLMDNVQTDVQRIVVSSDDIPKSLKDAFVSIEDERFYEHKGIDAQRILGALYIDVKNIVTGKRGLHGASTLTQQLLKNTILTSAVTTQRKITEMYLSLKLEGLLTKQQILEAYLNTIPLGGQVYGVEAASLKYFGQSVKDKKLTLVQCAYLAGMNQAPSYYDAFSPQNQKSPTSYRNRTKTVLSKMLEKETITQAQYDQAIKDVDAGNFGFQQKTSVTEKMNFEWFSRPVIQQVKNDLMQKYKYSEAEASKMLTNGGLKIYTTMDRDLQQATQQLLDDNNNFNLSNNKNEFYESGSYKWPKLQASATIMDYKTGQVKAMVGGRGNQPPMSINRAYSTSGLRSVGSATKPLTVYGPAIDMKLLTPASAEEDTPLPEEISKKYPRDEKGQLWNPQNEDHAYKGTISLRDALKYSRNPVAVKIEDAIGTNVGLSYGEKFGLKYNKASKSSIATLALGQFNNDPKDRDGGNSYIMAAAYGTFGNSGVYTEPILYTTVKDATGKVILDNTPETRKILSPQSAYVMYDLLKGPVSWSSAPAKFGDIPVAGKTGTTTDNKDLWFSGLTPYLSGAVWVGYDQPTTLKGFSGSAVSPIWGKIMAVAHKGLQSKEIEMPSGIVKASVCIDSGKSPTDLCSKDSRGNRVVQDIFIDGTQPTALCDVHVTAKINKANGKLATDNTPASLIEERVFVKNSTQAGIGLPTEQDDTKPTSPPTNTNGNNTSNGTNTNNSGANTGTNGTNNNTDSTNNSSNNNTNNNTWTPANGNTNNTNGNSNH
ncbi:PBP1A family penicillin-binding protein [Clostridium sp. YIM B02505]|uniref:Penicillin-binding protein 1A n=1 Tax=Clostridium yunnanense TaxID=2800325 RepID=A0ABS1EJ31_9CLOT|nr:PBP1A family penicillin-binding protein [Clostridium yunnanense]MBK1809350.1 PBP1A family penicillin-binding protein [Clostridium yunnanense]